MARLVRAIYSSTCAATDGPDKPGHDGEKARSIRFNSPVVCYSHLVWDNIGTVHNAVANYTLEEHCYMCRAQVMTTLDYPALGA